MKAINIGDMVSVVDEDVVGKVIEIKATMLAVQVDDGFSFWYSIDEVILLDQDQDWITDSDKVYHHAEQKEESVHKHKHVVKRKAKKVTAQTIEIDLHIEKLVAKPSRMQHLDILKYQIDTAKRKVEWMIQNKIPSIIFIHGVGEGILVAELHYWLGKYEEVKFCAADFRRYGYGATEVHLIPYRSLKR